MAKMTLNLEQDITNAFGEKIPFISTINGYYPIPIKKAKQVIKKLYLPTTPQVILTVTNTRSEKLP